MSVRVVKSSHASIKIPTLKMSLESGDGSEGYVSNIEGLLTRFENILKSEKENAEEESISQQQDYSLSKAEQKKQYLAA